MTSKGNRGSYMNTIKYIAAIVLLSMCSIPALAKMLPENGAVLTQTHIMFEYDQVPGATKYQVIIKQNNAINKASEMTFTSASLACLVTEGLQFGSEYSWRAEALRSGKIISSSPWQQFSIAWSQKIDTSFVQYHITHAGKKAYHNDLLFIDHLGALITRTGEPVWYFPEDKLPPSNDQFNFRAMRMTRDGTITFIYNGKAMDRGIDGFPLWDAPLNTDLSGAEVETYHHDLKKLTDGTYMVCGYHFENEPGYYDEKLQCHVRYNTLLQFNSSGSLVWFWNEQKHVNKSVIFRNFTSTETEIAGTHLNGFDLNPTDSSIILSFRNTSEVMKIDMNNFGKVVHTWTGPYSPKNANNEINFSSQHGPSVTPEGHIIIYNNNINNDRASDKVNNPKVLIVSNPGKNKPSVKLWEYEMVWDKRPEGVQGKEGYAMMLPNKNILINTGGAERMLEVTPAKKIVWECTYQKYDSAALVWKPFNNYRCGITSSLYPRYFTAEQVYSGNSLAGGSVKINNDGTENDRYQLEITDGIGNIIDEKTVSIKARSSAVVKWNNKQGKGKKQEAGIKVKIWPEGSMWMGRILNY